MKVRLSNINPSGGVGLNPPRRSTPIGEPVPAPVPGELIDVLEEALSLDHGEGYGRSYFRSQSRARLRSVIERLRSEDLFQDSAAVKHIGQSSDLPAKRIPKVGRKERKGGR
jgi:hypothetical protein